MKKIINICLVLIFSIIHLSCSNKNEINDIIPPFKLVSGTSDSIVIGDLYYSDNYNIIFNTNEHLSVEHDPQNNLLEIKSDENFEGMTLLEFEADMNLYHIPVISKKRKVLRVFI